MIERSPLILLSSGEPAGIGPDICAMLGGEALPARLVVLGSAAMLRARAEALGLNVRVHAIHAVDEAAPHRAGVMQVLDVPLRAPVRAGHLDPANSDYVVELLRLAVQQCVERPDSALVTAPVQKSVINEAGIPFTGHTEFLAEATQADMPVMMLVSRAHRVALATTHLPLAEVAQRLDRDRLERVLTILDRELRFRFGVLIPRLAVLGLNPHAGEHGVLGTEEQKIIEPVMRELRERGLSLLGPLPADTAFTPEALSRCDAIVAMYHDQGLAPLKALAFGEVVNITLGLPIVRTSVDHGTALDVAGSGAARPDSLREAVRTAIELVSRPET